MSKLKGFSGLFIFVSLMISSMLLVQGQEPVEPINWRELAPFLIDISGWEAMGKPEGSTVSMGNFKMSQGERSYTDKDKRLKITLVDGGYVQMFYAGFKMAMSFEIDTSEEYVKKVIIKGFPGVETYKYNEKKGSVMILIAERFLLQLEGENLKNTSRLKADAKTLDLKGIAKLAK